MSHKMFQNFFGDDEHTAADGPYSRVMKTRKWLCFTAAISTMFNLNLINTSKFSEVFKIFSMKNDVIMWSLFGANTYLLIIYAALCFQLVVVYDLILADRLRFRKDEEIANAQAKVDDSKRDVIRLDEDKKRRLKFGAISLSGEKEYSEQEHDAATAVYNRNVEALAKIIASDPSDRKFFKEIEVSIDIARIILPAIASAISIYFLASK